MYHTSVFEIRGIEYLSTTTNTQIMCIICDL